jgi:hypothetical protein
MLEKGTGVILVTTTKKTNGDVQIKKKECLVFFHKTTLLVVLHLGLLPFLPSIITSPFPSLKNI